MDINDLPVISLDRTHIRQRQQHLEACRAHLKTQFIGIDAIIDSLINHIRIWYLLPEILTRPVVINLWGMTGVGKTDLVRQLVKFLDFYDRFVEIELSNIDQSSWHNSVYDIFDNHQLNDGEPAIVLFDEIQRFNTINNDGEPVAQTKFMDFWELLSDGRLSKKDRYDVDIVLLEALARQQRNKQRQAKGERAYEPDYLSAYDIRNYQKHLGLGLSAEELATMNEDDMIALVRQSKQEKTMYEPINHRQTLIIIGGNLDEAFRMADQTSESDVDADIFHAFTEKITLVDIKAALSHKFRPEQVARFGNIHLIYRSLTKADFQQLIAQEIDNIIERTDMQLGIRLHVDASVHRLIYRNGVFPVQGVRPVFSSVSDILETHLSGYLFEAMMAEVTAIYIRYDPDAQKLIAEIGEVDAQTITTPFVGRIDRIREANQADAVTNISIHEAGHALVYMLRFGLAPLQLKSKIASSYSAGFTFPHQIHETRQSMLDQVMVFLAGGLAEALVFGEDHASVGRANDRERATQLVSDYIRRYGFEPDYQSVYAMEDAYAMDKKPTDAAIETKLKQLIGETQALIESHQDCLLALGRTLSTEGDMEVSAIAAIAADHHIVVEIKPEGHLHISPYGQQLSSALYKHG